MTYRKIETKLWGDSKVEELSCTATYLLLYLLTAPGGNIVGCYEVTPRRIARDIKMRDNTVRSAIKELCDSDIIGYNEPTCEVLVKNWSKYNLTKSRTLVKPYVEATEGVKHQQFRDYLVRQFEELFGIPYGYGVDTVSEPYGCDTDTHSVSVSVTDTVSDSKDKKVKDASQVKHKHGKFGNVLLTDSELDSLKEKFSDWQERIDNLSYYIGSTGKHYKSHYMTILAWDRKNTPRKVTRHAQYD